jgi:hypothetical protein
MEPELSLQCSQEPATGFYPEPDESRPHLPILLLYEPFLCDLLLFVSVCAPY